MSEQTSERASERASEQLVVVDGLAQVECRVAIVVWCPVCGRQHGHVLTARDHPHLAGPRYWRVACQGVPYMLRLSSTQIVAALTQALDISLEHLLSYRWRLDSTYEHCCVDVDQPG